MKALIDAAKERTRGTKDTTELLLTLMAFQILDHYDITPRQVAECFSGVIDWIDAMRDPDKSNRLTLPEIKDTLESEYGLTIKQTSKSVKIECITE